MKNLSSFLIVFLFSQSLVGQLPTYESISVSVSEGTNMATALSPDKETLAIDLQGRLWTLAAKGGTATPITDSLGDARQPAWSPDGQQITFQGYWDGNWHIYTVQKDGSNLKQWTHGQFDHREPHWSPDGQQVLFSSDRAGTYDIWALHLITNDLIPITKDPTNEFAPAWSPNGERIAYVSDEPDKAGIYVLDLDKRDLSLIKKSEGATINQNAKQWKYKAKGKIAGLSWRPDGTSILFNETTFSKSQLYAQWLDMPEPVLLSNEEEVVFPFRPTWVSNKEYIYTSSGKIYQKAMDFKQEKTIPFEATFHLQRAKYAKKQRDFDSTAPQKVKGILTPSLSPDGQQIAFITLNDLWLQTGEEQAVALTNNAFIEMSPEWAPDGKQLAYVSDSGGEWAIWTIDLHTKMPKKLVAVPGNASNIGIDWSPNGAEIAISLGIHPRLGQLYVYNLESKEIRKISQAIPASIGAPTWSADSETIAISTRQSYSTLYREGINRLLFFSKEGTSTWKWKNLPHWSLGSRRKDGPVWSPDGKYMAAISQGLLWIIPVDKMGQATGMPIRLSNDLADAPSWSGDGKTILYQTIQGLKTVNIQTGLTKDISLDLKWSRQIPIERTVIHVAGLIDGRQERIQEDVDIILEGNRIVAIESHQANRTADKWIDASSSYAVPGLIDIHAHQGSWAGEKLGRTWLAWGVTATRDPSTVALDALNRREATESGRYRGPRIFFTGSPIDGNRIYYADAQAQQSPAQLTLELQKAEALDYDMIKTYVRLADPLQQRVVNKAHELGIPVSSHELYPAVAYGTDGVEHIAGTSRRGYSPKLTSVLSSYGDVSSLLGASGMSFTPTIGIYVSYNFLLSKNPAVLEDQRLIALTSTFNIDNARRGIATVEKDKSGWELRFKNATKMIKDIHDKNGLVVAGTDGPILPFGFGLHLELEAYQVAGLSPFEVLQTATLNGAKVLGTEKDMGTLEVGKLADILIVKENPLEDVKHLREMELVVINGKVYRLEDLLKRDE